MKGYFVLVLHSHLPYLLSHGRWPYGTDWLSEACAETYIPLLNTLNQLIAEGYKPHLTISLTPVLCEQLSSEDFETEFAFYLKHKIEAARADRKEFIRYGETEYLRIAEMWLNYYEAIEEDFFNHYRKDLISAFKKLQDEGYIEIITSAATHGFLPLLKEECSIKGQIKTGIYTYQHHFGRQPKGFWLPECGYRPRYLWQAPEYPAPPYERPGIDEFLSDENLEYFITDLHLLKGGKAIGVYLPRFEILKKLWTQFETEFEPRDKEFEGSPHQLYLVTSNPQKKPMPFFTRDPKTALQVWSGEWGYPGDAWYLDFHKKRFPSGLRYWRVTDPKLDLGKKELYQPEKIEERIYTHTQHFVSLIKETLVEYHNLHNRPGVICAPYDTELFGHWWFEGPKWLYNIFKSLAEEKEITAITGSEYLAKFYPEKVVSLPEGSWGEGGFHYIWFNEDTKWTWKIIYEAEEEFKNIVLQPRTSGLDRILKQLARELLLLQSSDWQFLITTFSAREYAEERFLEHSEKFNRLLAQTKKIKNGESLADEETNYLLDCEKSDNIFQFINLNWFT